MWLISGSPLQGQSSVRYSGVPAVASKLTDARHALSTYLG